MRGRGGRVETVEGRMESSEVEGRRGEEISGSLGSGEEMLRRGGKGKERERGRKGK